MYTTVTVNMRRLGSRDLDLKFFSVKCLCGALNV